MPEAAFEHRPKYDSALLQEWQRRRKRGIWLQIPTEKAELLQIATATGFDFHHAKPGYAMLTKWLPSTPCTIPENILYNVSPLHFLSDSMYLAIHEDHNLLLSASVTSAVDKNLAQQVKLCRSGWELS